MCVCACTRTVGVVSPSRQAQRPELVFSWRAWGCPMSQEHFGLVSSHSAERLPHSLPVTVSFSSGLRSPGPSTPLLLPLQMPPPPDSDSWESAALTSRKRCGVSQTYSLTCRHLGTHSSGLRNNTFSAHQKFLPNHLPKETSVLNLVFIIIRLHVFIVLLYMYASLNSMYYCFVCFKMLFQCSHTVCSLLQLACFA